jgi:septal ring factor EnvC (AmiA/AmiB activator)
MWPKIVEFGRQMFSVMQKQSKHDEDIKEIRQDVKSLQEDFIRLRLEVNNLTHVVERLATSIQQEQKNAENSREIYRLQLENVLLRFERGLPPGAAQQDE